MDFGTKGDRFKTPWRQTPGPGSYELKVVGEQPSKNSYKGVFQSKVERLHVEKVE